MSNEFDFEPRLGKIGHQKPAKPKQFVRKVLDVAYKSGFKTKRTSSLTGQRLGRGSARGDACCRRLDEWTYPEKVEGLLIA